MNLVLPDERRTVSLSPILAAGNQNSDIVTNTNTGAKESKGGSRFQQLAFFCDLWRKLNGVSCLRVKSFDIIVDSVATQMPK